MYQKVLTHNSQYTIFAPSILQLYPRTEANSNKDFSFVIVCVFFRTSHIPKSE